MPAHAHAKLDAAAYGWPSDLSDDSILEKLLALNHERAAAEKVAGKSSKRSSRAAAADELL